MCKNPEQRRPLKRSWEHKHLAVNFREMHECLETQSDTVKVSLKPPSSSPILEMTKKDTRSCSCWRSCQWRCEKSCAYESFVPVRFQQHIPFRESKLTHYLQGFFCGRGKACMIVNINQCASMYDETLNVLKFSAVAQKVSQTHLSLLSSSLIWCAGIFFFLKSELS